MVDHVLRPIAAAQRIGPGAGRLAHWIDRIGIDGAFDSDPGASMGRAR